MNPECSLPVLLVSACDRATAEEFISELIDNEVIVTENGHENGDVSGGSGRVWRLVNKYYTADVLVCAHGDADPPPADSAQVQAHVIYFTPQECEAEASAAAACAERRARARAAVRVAAMRAAAAGALGAWAARARYEPVPLLGASAEHEQHEQHEARGVERVREALHAHPWPGLRRLDRSAPTPFYPESEESSQGSECSEGSEQGVERAEQWAAALGALDAARGVGAGALSDSERRLRAEQLLSAFCEALGHRLDL